MGRKTNRPGGEKGVAHAQAVEHALLVGELNEQDRVFLHDAHEQDKADETVEIDGLMPVSKSARSAPVTLKGSASSTARGWMKLLNCEASTM